MKKVFVSLLVLVALASVAGCILGATALRCYAGNSLRGSGKIVSRTLPAPDFKGIDASRGVKVIVTDQATAITVEADDNIIDLVVVEADDDLLKVGIDNSKKNIRNADVTVTVPANGKIRSLHASSASRIVARTPLAAERFSIDVSSGSSVKATVTAENCSVGASSGGMIDAVLEVVSCSVDLSSGTQAELSGKADICRADMSSGSQLSAFDFSVGEYTIDVSSGAGAEITCTKVLRADASSGSSIRYAGDCQTHNNMSSGASIRKVNR